MTIRIKFEYDDLKHFIRTTESFYGEIDAVKGRYIIDAKSLMGMLSITFNNGFDVTLHSDDEKEISRFEAEMERWRY